MALPERNLASPPPAAHQVYPFVLADLPYGYDALEPHIDQKTLQVHHRGHHATYVKKLNEAIARHPELQKLTLAQLLEDPARVPAESRTAVRHNGGEHLNHDIFCGTRGRAHAALRLARRIPQAVPGGGRETLRERLGGARLRSGHAQARDRRSQGP